VRPLPDLRAVAPAPKKRLSAQGLANIRAGVRKRMMAQPKIEAVQNREPHSQHLHTPVSF
jgi:hypothetical protein